MAIMLLATVLIPIYTAFAEPPVPSLPKRYSAIVEANIIQKNQTWIMEEWYDETANKAKRIIFYDDIISVTYEDFSDAKDQIWTYSTSHDDTSSALSCKLESYRDHRSWYRSEETQSGNIVSSAEWFQFGGNYSETYLGSDFVIRGISAQGWTRNVTRSITHNNLVVNQSFVLTYYFAIPRWDWFKSSEHQIPVRVELTGTRVIDNGTFVTPIKHYHHYYDYIQFLAEDLILEEGLQFDIPDFYEQCNVSSYCSKYKENDICSLTKGPPLPKFPHSFSTVWEWSAYDDVYTSTQVTIMYEMHYDYESDRSHTIYTMAGASGNLINIHYLELLKQEDGAQIWTWINDESSSDDTLLSCNMFGVSSKYTGFQYGIQVENGSLLNPGRTFLFNDNTDPQVGTELWMGYTTVRGIPAEKWKAAFNATINGGEDSIFLTKILPSNQRAQINADIFWYFSVANWSFGYDTNDSVIPLAAKFIGTFDVYNYSDASDAYELFETKEMNEVFHAFKWLPGKVDDAWFQPPTYWRKYCEIDSSYCDASEHEEHKDLHVCDQGLDLPSLPQHKYYAVIEGTDEIHQNTTVIKTWYNYDTNEYRNEYYKDNLVIVTYDALEDDQRWIYVYFVNDSENIISCNVVPFTSTLEPGSEQFSEEYVDTGHVKTSADLWRFGDNWNVTYLGDGFSVRGIDARAWHTINNMSFEMGGYTHKSSYETIYYFAKDWDYYKAIETSDIPLRVDLKGKLKSDKNTTEFGLQFHVVSFFSGPQAFDEDEMKDVFDDWYAKCNVTSYCDKYSDADICNGKEKVKKKDTKANDDTLVYIIAMPVLFLLGLLFGACFDRYLMRQKGYAAFKNEATADAAL